MRRWLPVTVSEVRQYIAIFLYQGVLWKPTYEMYYTTNPLFASAGIKWLLSYNKFKLIDKFIHFVDSSTLPNRYPVLSKISTVWDYLTKKFQEVYTPTQNQLMSHFCCGTVDFLGNSVFAAKVPDLV